MDDRRRQPRYEVRGLTCSIDDQSGGEVLKLSRIGMLAVAPAEPRVGSIVDVQIELPGTVFRSAARVAFSGPDTNAPERRRSRVGVEFLETPPSSAQVLDRFIKEQLAAF
jgi:PilZ domain-containing protein